MSSNDCIDKLLKSAEREMLKLNHPYVGSEHLILALLKDEDIKQIAYSYDLTYNSFKNELINVIGKSNIKTTTILHTPLLKSIIEDTKSYAIKHNNGIITPTILFINILESGDGIGVRMLISLNVDVDSLYKALKNNINSTFSYLNKYGYDLSDNDTDLIGRDDVIDQIIQILYRKNKNNPLLIGEAGVGKTAIVEAVSKKIKKYDSLSDYRIYSIDMSLVLSGSKYRGDFEEKINNVIKEVIENGKVILFIDEIHIIMKAGGSEGAIDAANILKPYLSKGEIKIIGATTIDEYDKYIKPDKALVRRFDLIYVDEPDVIRTTEILCKIKKKYSIYHGIKITKKNIDVIVNYANKYMLDKKNPDKSIDLLDSVCSYVKSNNRNSISRSDIEKVLYRKINRVATFSKDIVLNNLKNKVYGQDDVLSYILDIVSKDGYKKILLTGGVGVGKSLSVSELSNQLNMKYINIDMSEFNNYYSMNLIYNGENSLFNRLTDNAIILFDNIEKSNDDVLDVILKIIVDKKIKDKDFSNSIIFLSATNYLKYGIGFNKTDNIIKYNNKKVYECVDYIVNYNDIDEKAISKYIEFNNIRDFDYSLCDYKNYGFRAIKIGLNSRDMIK